MSQMTGTQSIRFDREIYVNSYASVVGKKEGEGPLGAQFDQVEEDPLFGCSTWEEAESRFQTEAARRAVKKAGLSMEEIRLIYAGDLLAQCAASTFGIANLERPLYGLFGACSTMGEALSMASMAVAGGYADPVLALTSSHFCSAEKEFRFPLDYGSQRPLSATWTVTGSGACVVGTRKSHVRITGLTTGKIVDYGLKDSQNMGACMAPAACDTISRNLADFGKKPEDYDRIITGDLGCVGQQILFDLLEQEGWNIRNQHLDCGMMIFDPEKQDTHAGGSGCGCSASVLAADLLPKVSGGEWKRILFVPTGALMSKVSFYEGQSVPGIAHAVILEHVEG